MKCVNDIMNSRTRKNKKLMRFEKRQNDFGLPIHNRRNELIISVQKTRNSYTSTY